tara:strand:- start:2450 stop:4522 length:2073 start_codon:yes stop_codon:yes gene_type:complete
MPSKLKDLLFNPFARRVVDRPRKIEITIDELNGRVIRGLQREFAVLTEGAVPRSRPTSPQIQFIASPDPGYGKSHLLGRLFQVLERQATRIYVTPFTDPSNSWSSVLSRIIQEMSLPENGNAAQCLPGEPSQLDAFAQGILGQAFAALAGTKPMIAPKNPAILEAIRGRPLDTWDLADPENHAAAWVRGLTGRELAEAGALLPSLNSELQPGSSAAAWLKVLFFYAIDRENTLRRGACLEWMEAKVHRSDIADLGLSPADALDDDADRSRRNEEARARVLDLCSLAGLFRPFVIAFDQTETYGQKPELANAFGNLMADLFHEAPNQMTIVTANQDKWQKDLEPYIDNAHQERLGMPVYLEEIDRRQAEILARRRLAACDVAPSEIERFIDDSWLETAVRAGGSSVRRFLEAASMRFSDLIEESVSSPDLDELFKMEKLALSGQRARLTQYRADLYRWALRDVFNAAESDRKAEVFSSHRDYLQIAWPSEDGLKLLFGFEDRDNHRTWEAIAREAQRQIRAHDGKCRVILIRLDNQPVIPHSNWAAAPFIEDIQDEGLFFHQLSEERHATLHALWDLYSRSCQGDIDATPKTILQFAANELRDWWAELLSPALSNVATQPDPHTPDPSLVEAVREMIRQQRFLGEEALLNALEESMPEPPGIDDVREICQDYLAEVRVHVSPTAAAYVWQS